MLFCFGVCFLCRMRLKTSLRVIKRHQTSLRVTKSHQKRANVKFNQKEGALFCFFSDSAHNAKTTAVVPNFCSSCFGLLFWFKFQIVRRLRLYASLRLPASPPISTRLPRVPKRPYRTLLTVFCADFVLYVLDCFLDLGFEWFAGWVKISREKSNKVKISQKKWWLQCL